MMDLVDHDLVLMEGHVEEGPEEWLHVIMGLISMALVVGIKVICVEWDLDDPQDLKGEVDHHVA